MKFQQRWNSSFGASLAAARYFVCVVCLLGFVKNTLAQDCEDVFPGPVSTSRANGEIEFDWMSYVTGADNGVLITRNISHVGGASGTCGASNCVASGTTADDSSYSNFPSGGDISTSWGQSITVSPGNYDDLDHGGNGTIYMQPGLYTFAGEISSNTDSSIEVASPGTVAIFVAGDVELDYRFRLNTINNSDRQVFIYSGDDIFVNNESVLHAVLYAEDDIEFLFQSQLTGAATAENSNNAWWSRPTIFLDNESVVNYDASRVGNTDFYGFCVGLPNTPDLVAEWRLDELSWEGNADEVLDSGPNGLHGRAVDVDPNLYPSTDYADPAIAGNPGTCSYGDFGGTTDGYVVIDDPGAGSVLDLTEFTVTSWIYPRSWATSGLATIVSKDENFEYHLNGSGQVNWWWGGGSQELLTSSAIPLNEWHHIAITYESGSQVIYIDGVSAATNNSTGSITTNDDGVHIGTDWNYHSRRFNGFIDEVRIYDAPMTQAEVAAVMAETHPCTNLPSLDHFYIDVGAGSASTCFPTEITITAEDSSNNTISDYTGTVEISTSSNNGDWSNTAEPSDALGTLTAGVSDSGAASYEFESGELDQGSIVLNLGNSHAQQLTITVEDSSAGVSSTSASIAFSDNAFVVSTIDSTGALVDPLGDDVVAGRDHQFLVEMWQNGDSPDTCSVASAYNIADVKVWITRAASDPAGSAPAITNAANTDTEVLADSQPGSPNFTLPFVAGKANFTLSTSDVGRYAINFLDDSSGFSDSDITGGSSSLVARPFAFDVQVTDNPAADTPGGALFKYAGEVFEARVRAVAWQASDDINGDGIADGHNDSDPSTAADLSDNAVLPSFGQESPAEGVQLSAELNQPSGGNHPGLASDLSPPADARQLTTFSGGIDTTSAIYYGEVGIIEIATAILDGDYLGSSFTARIHGRSGYVGRFWPSYFALSADLHTPACNTGGFSYLGQASLSEYTLQANSTRNVLTQNYTGGFARFDPDSGFGSAAYGAINNSSSTFHGSRITASTTVTWGLGSAAVDAQVSLLRDPVPDGPFTAVEFGVLVSDADGVSLRSTDLDLDISNDSINDHIKIGQSASLFGRLRLADAFGPETADLPVVFVTEYWNGSLWRTHEDDDCTAISLTHVIYPGGTIDSVTNRTISVGGGSSTGVYAGLSSGDIDFASGEAGHFFTAPGAGNTGVFQVNVNLAAYPWLRSDWNLDGDYGDLTLPAASYSFGSYRGHDRVIYWREVLRSP